MALVAMFSLLALVGIVLLVTAVTVGIDFLGVGTERVAGFAGEIPVRTVECEIGVGGMIELGVRPAPDDMAAFALVAIQAFVHVVGSVAGVAIPHLVFTLGYAILGRVAFVAAYLAMAAFERVVRIALVIEGGLVPAFFLVAIFALLAEAVGMHVADLVAADALLGRILVLAADMAGVAVDALV